MQIVSQDHPSPSHSNNTFLMSGSPAQGRRSYGNYRPKIVCSVGQRPACLVLASVTYVGNNEIYAFGGFDQFTDEVYNHVLRLNLDTMQWNLVDNYGDIPGVRMGHTATLWQGEKVLIFGGENEHRAYLSDLIIFDIKTAHWHQPELRGPPPRGRARHSAVIYDDKLFIVGGLSGNDNKTVMDDIVYLDLKKWEWSRSWRFVPRYGHTCWVWGDRIWVFGGLTENKARTNELWWLDLRHAPGLDSYMMGPLDHRGSEPRPYRAPSGNALHHATATAEYRANSGLNTTSSLSASRKPLMAPGSISSLNFISGPHIPSQAIGTHFHAFSSGYLLDFVTPAVTNMLETSLCALDLETMRWEKLADGRDLFNQNYCWHYCTLNGEGTNAWLLGCPEPSASSGGTTGEYLSDVLPLDLKKLGLLGNSLVREARSELAKLPVSDAHVVSSLSGIGADLAKMFNDPSNADFVVTANAIDADEEEDDVEMGQALHTQPARVSPEIHVHRLILEARWPHFARMIAAQMAEFHSKKLHIPEPFHVVRAFLRYLYTDSISADSREGPSLSEVAGMLVMSSCYDMPRLRILCRSRLGRELDIEHAALIWERAGTAGEDWLKRRAASFCLTYWGRVVRTPAFLSLKRTSMAELCQEIDHEGRVLGANELESVGGLAGARFGDGVGPMPSRSGPPARGLLTEDADEGDEEESMEMS